MNINEIHKCFVIYFQYQAKKVCLFKLVSLPLYKKNTMALTILYTATRASDFKSFSVADNGTAWGVGGEMNVGDVTGITLSIFGTDKTTALKEVEFTAPEIAYFVGGSDVVFQFSDSRLWYPTTYAPDNHYSLQLEVFGGTTVSTQVAIDSWFYMKKIVNNSFASTHTPQSTFYEANRSVVGNLVSLLQLQYESDIVSIPRENMWRKVYNDLALNYANVL